MAEQRLRLDAEGKIETAYVKAYPGGDTVLYDVRHSDKSVTRHRCRSLVGFNREWFKPGA